MAESAALLTDDILPRRPLRQWVLSSKLSEEATESEAENPVLNVEIPERSIR